jgi:hypothetical protein
MTNAASRGRKKRPVISRTALLLVIFLSACLPSVTPAALPTPAALEVQITAALQPLGEQFRNCVLELPNTGLVLLETPAAALDLDRSTLALRWGAGSAQIDYAAVIGEEELVVIAHPSNPLAQITIENLRAAYQGLQREWPETSEEIQAWAYPGGDDVQEVFEGAVLGESASAAGTTWLAPDPGAMRAAVAANPAALGFLPSKWIDDTVKALPIQGLEPTRLRQPVLALSKSEPTGPEKAWLICLQQAP